MPQQTVGIRVASVTDIPPGEGIAIRRSVRAMAGAEAQYLFDLRRRYRINDPAIASLGRQMRSMHSR